MYEFGNRLKLLRKRRGFSQASLGVRINKSKSAISSYESNSQMPPLDVLVSIAQVLDVSLDYLVGFEHNADYSAKGLSAEQIAFADELFAEFRTPTRTDEKISPMQAALLADLVELFRNSD